VPVSAMPQVVSPGPVALPWALHVIAPEEVNAPWAVPVSRKSPAQVALNEPLAVVLVCSVAVHRMSVQVPGDGMRFDDVQVPSSAPDPTAEGPVVEELLRSKSKHAAADTAAVKIAARRVVLFMVVLSSAIGRTRPAH
jgi:hypothetical protein